MRSVRYDDWWLALTLWISVVILKLILARTVSQCNSLRTGLMLSHQHSSDSSRARLFWTNCNLSRFNLDMLIRSKLQWANDSTGHCICGRQVHGSTNVNVSIVTVRLLMWSDRVIDALAIMTVMILFSDWTLRLMMKVHASNLSGLSARVLWISQS